MFQTSQDPLEHVLAADLSGPPSPAPPASNSQTSNLSRDASMMSVSTAANATAPLYANLHPDTQVGLLGMRAREREREGVRV